jgi:hypothetical protein
MYFEANYIRGYLSLVSIFRQRMVRKRNIQ